MANRNGAAMPSSRDHRSPPKLVSGETGPGAAADVENPAPAFSGASSPGVQCQVERRRGRGSSVIQDSVTLLLLKVASVRAPQSAGICRSAYALRIVSVRSSAPSNARSAHTGAASAPPCKKKQKKSGGRRIQPCENLFEVAHGIRPHVYTYTHSTVRVYRRRDPQRRAACARDGVAGI